MTGARLHVLLGEGGVGKTTLAAGYALALSRAGRRVGLLGIDPARRLQSALGIGPLSEIGTVVPGWPGLRAALLRPEESLRRWATEECRDPDSRERLQSNPFFLALADRLAGATDALAAVRVAEWAERDPALQDLIVDTAPGLHGVGFLLQPEKLLALLRGRLVRWLSRVAGGARTRGAARSARRVLGGLRGLGGATLLSALAEFFSLVGDVAGTMSARIEQARGWLRSPDTELLLVCGPRAGTAQGTRRLREAMAAACGPPAAVVLNRALPAPAMAAAPLLQAPPCPEAQAFVRFVRGTARLQAQAKRDLQGLPERVIAVPAVGGLDGSRDERLAALDELGRGLARGLLAPRVERGLSAAVAGEGAA